MTTEKYAFQIGICSLPYSVGDQYYENAELPGSDRERIRINPPPEDGRCNICRRHVSELKAFGGPGDPVLGDYSGAKLVKNFREDYPDYITPSWECRECLVLPGPLWAIDEERRRGRPLTEREYIDMEHEIKLRLLEFYEETN